MVILNCAGCMQVWLFVARVSCRAPGRCARSEHCNPVETEQSWDIAANTWGWLRTSIGDFECSAIRPGHYVIFRVDSHLVHLHHTSWPCSLHLACIEAMHAWA